MKRFAVIDTETTWHDKVMSIGVIIADAKTKEPIEGMYYLLDPEYKAGGMYSSSLHLPGIEHKITDSKENVLKHLDNYLKENEVSFILAYNAKFDRRHLPELGKYVWCDIMRLAAYKTYNKKIPDIAPCCATGRLKTGYGVQPMLRLLSGEAKYDETHNAYFDSFDELKIVKLLGYDLETYDEVARI